MVFKPCFVLLTYVPTRERNKNSKILMSWCKAKLWLCMQTELSCWDQDKYLPGIQTRACGLSQQVNFCWECWMDERGSFCVMWLYLQQSRNPPKKWTYILCRFTQLPTIRPSYYSTSPRSFALLRKMFSCIFEILVKKSGSILFFLLPWKLLLLVFAAPR